MYHRGVLFVPGGCLWACTGSVKIRIWTCFGTLNFVSRKFFWWISSVLEVSFEGWNVKCPWPLPPSAPKRIFCLTKRIGTPQDSTNNLQNLPYFLEFFSKILNFFKKNEKFSKKIRSNFLKKIHFFWKIFKKVRGAHLGTWRIWKPQPFTKIWGAKWVSFTRPKGKCPWNGPPPRWVGVRGGHPV